MTDFPYRVYRNTLQQGRYAQEQPILVTATVARQLVALARAQDPQASVEGYRYEYAICIGDRDEEDGPPL